MGQLANLSSLGADAGVSHATASHWLTVLEASSVVFRFPPFRTNFRKRLIKAPKLYFYGVGLARHVIGIESPRQIGAHRLRGPLLEKAVVVEALKRRFNRGRRSNLSFFLDNRGLECGLLYENVSGACAFEIKSGAIAASDRFDSLNLVAKELPVIFARTVVYGGSERQFRPQGEVVPLTALDGELEKSSGRTES